MIETATHCPYCALQCGMMVVEADGEWSIAARDFPTNRGGLCRKGWTAATLLDHPDRLTTPLMRADKGAPLRPASWDEALDHVAGAIRRIQDSRGPDAIGLFGGGGLTNEKAYQLGKFARVALGTANIDYNGRFCMASAAAAGIRAFGIDRGLPFPLSDLADADAILLVCGNPADTMPPIMQWFEAQKAGGGQLIVADPRRTATAAAATLHLQLTPGTDAALALALLNVAIRDKLIDADFIARRTTGFDKVQHVARSWWPDRAERVTGVPAELIHRAAHMLGQAKHVIILSGRGPEQQSRGVDNVTAFINLALALGKAGVAGSGWGCLTGQGNGQGGREHGQKADQLPGYRKLADPADRAAVAKVWNVHPDTLPAPGLPASLLLDALGGEVQGLLVFAANIAVSAPDTGRLRERLATLDLLVVADPFLSETAELADVVLPVTQWAEEEGTMTNLEGRVIRRRRAKAPPADVWTDSQIMVALAERLGRGDMFGRLTEPADLFDELRRASAGGVADYAGISYERIECDEGAFWPCPSNDHPGTPRLFLDGFAFADRRARFHVVSPGDPAELPDATFPYYLTTGRVMGQYQSGNQTRRIPELAAAEPHAFVQIHPDTARTLGIGEGAPVDVGTRRGTARLTAKLSRDIRFDTLFVPFHWAGAGNANLLTSNQALDPVSRIPEFKLSAAWIKTVTNQA
ncbi:molybdopterin oxidoreductase family protein [soil metagenome]